MKAHTPAITLMAGIIVVILVGCGQDTVVQPGVERPGADPIQTSQDSRGAAEAMTIGELFELAALTGFRVPVIASDPDDPSLQDAVIIARWQHRFFRYLEEEVSLDDLVICVTRVLDGVHTEEIMTLERLIALARETGFRIPVIASDLRDPTLQDALILARWRDRFLRFLDEEIPLGELVTCITAVLRGDDPIADVALTWEQHFSLARRLGFRVPVIAFDPDDPTLSEAVILNRWRDRFYRFLAEETTLADLVGHIEDVLRA